MALALSGLSLWILRDALFQGGAFYERDLLSVYYPMMEALVRTIAEGAWPLRDTTTGFGQPILANPDAQVLYPTTWLHLLMLPDRAYSIIVLIHYVMGALGAAALAWRFNPVGKAALVAGAFWVASGPFQSMLTLWHHLAGAAWMPWVLVAFDRVVERSDRRRVLILASSFGLQILAGSADMCAMTLCLALLLLLCHTQGSTLRKLWPPLQASLLALLIAIALGSAIWLTAGQIVNSSFRASLPFEARTFWSIHPLTLAELGLPLGLGTLGLNPDMRDLVSGGREPFIESLYLGSLLLPLFMGGLAASFIPRRFRLFCGIGVGVAVLGALGGHTPFYEGVTTLLPFLRLFRYPSKLMIPASLLIAVLAGATASRLEGGLWRRVVLAMTLLLGILHAGLFLGMPQFASEFLASGALSANVAQLQRSLVLSLAPLLLLGASFFSDRSAFRSLAILSGVGITQLLNAGINPTVANQVLRFKPEQALLVRTAEPSRLYVHDYIDFPLRTRRLLGRASPFEGLKTGGSSQILAYILAVRSNLMPSVGSAWGIEYAFDMDLRGLFRPTLRDATLSIGSPSLEGTAAFLRLLQIANVSHVVSLHRGPFALLRLERAIETPLPEPMLLFTVPTPLPRAYAVSGTRILGTDEALRTLVDPGFNPALEVILDAGAASPPSTSFASNVRIMSRQSDQIVLDVTMSEAGSVVLLEGFLPGWNATVDDVAVPVRQANGLFVAVGSAAGHHRVVFSYRPWTATVGVLVTVLTALALIAALSLSGREGVS